MSTEEHLVRNDQDLPEPHREWRGHNFWPPASELTAIPPLYVTEEVAEADKVVHLHYFVAACDWWIVELDPRERLAFGYACLGDPQMAEWGYIDLGELADVFRPPSFGESLPGMATTITPALIVERDLGWTPRPAGEVIPYL